MAGGADRILVPDVVGELSSVDEGVLVRALDVPAQRTPACALDLPGGVAGDGPELAVHGRAADLDPGVVLLADAAIAGGLSRIGVGVAVDGPELVRLLPVEVDALRVGGRDTNEREQQGDDEPCGSFVLFEALNGGPHGSTVTWFCRDAIGWTV